MWPNKKKPYLRDMYSSVMNAPGQRLPVIRWDTHPLNCSVAFPWGTIRMVQFNFTDELISLCFTAIHEITNETRVPIEPSINAGLSIFKKGEKCDETLPSEENQLVDRCPIWIDRNPFTAGDHPSRHIPRVGFLVDDDRFPDPCDRNAI